MIVYSAPSSGSLTDLFLINADGSKQRPLTFDHRGEHSPSWSPAGSSIVYSGYVRRADPALLLLHPHARKPRVLFRKAASTQALIEYPVWSPTGRDIAFSLTERDDTRACVLHVGGRYTCTRSLADHPTWSPSGARLAYTDGVGVVTATAGFHKVRRIAATSFEDSFPVWSPNGKWIALRHSEGQPSTDSIDIVTPNGRTRRRLISSARGGSTGPVAWSPDSDAVLVLQTSPAKADADRRLAIVSLRTRRITPLAGTFGVMGSASWHR